MKMQGLCAAVLLSLALPVAAIAAETTVLHCDQVFDAKRGKLTGEMTLVIEDGRIKAMSAGHSDPAGGAARTINLKGMTCLPGLIDSHVHLTGETSPTGYTDQFRWNVADYAIRSTVYARRTLEAGFTTVRNLGDGDNASISLRNAINQGVVPGPRIYTAGSAIGSTGGHADGTDGYRADLQGDPGPKLGIINGPDDAWKAVRQHYKDGADLIKIMPSGGVLDESSSVDNAQMTM